MKIDVNESSSVFSGFSGSDSFGIDPENFGMALEKLYEYQDPIGSIVREITSNAVDGLDEAELLRDRSIDDLMEMGIFEEYRTNAIKEGKDETLAMIEWKTILGKMKDRFRDWEREPVSVRLETRQANPFDPADSYFVVKDKGVGLSPIRVKRIYSRFLSSTKRKTGHQMGAFGLGAKSPLGYTPSFTLITSFDDTEYTYIISKGEAAPQITLINEAPTSEGNYTIVEVPVNSGDNWKVKDSGKRQLSYFDGIETVDMGVIDGDIFTGNNFVYKENPPSGEIHLVLGRAYYPLQKTYIPDLDFGYCPIGLRFTMDEISKNEKEGCVSIVWNRESVQYNDATIKAIQTKIEAAREELFDLYKAQTPAITDMKTFLSARSQDKEDLVLNMGSKEITLPYGKKFIGDRIRPNYTKYGALKKIPKNLFFNWDIVKVIKEDTYRLSNPPRYYGNFDKILSNALSNDRDFAGCEYESSDSTSSIKSRFIIEEKLAYPDSVCLVRKVKSDENGYIDSIKAASYFGYNNPTSEDLILVEAFMDEVDDLIRDLFPRYKDIEPSKEFLDKLEAEKKAQREKKKERIARGVHEFPVRRFVRDWDNRKGSPWRRSNMSISSAEERTTLTIYGTNEDRNALENVAYVLMRIPRFEKALQEDEPRYGGRHLTYKAGGRTLYRKNPNGSLITIPKREAVRVLLVSKQNTSYFEENPHAMHVEDFKATPHKVLRRFITALMIQDRLPDNFSNVINPTIEEAAPRFVKAARHLNTYIKENLDSSLRLSTSVNSPILEAMVKTYAEEDKRRRAQNRMIDKKGVAIPKNPPVYDDSVMESYATVARYLKLFPLLPSILETANAGDVKEYLRLRATINVDLLARRKKA